MPKSGNGQRNFQALFVKVNFLEVFVNVDFLEGLVDVDLIEGVYLTWMSMPPLSSSLMLRPQGRRVINSCCQ